MFNFNEDGLTPTDATYHGLIGDVLENGNVKGDRTGTGTVAVVGRMARYSLLNGRSPRPTTKWMTDNPEREAIWFRNGSSSIKELRDQGIGIWNNWLMPGTARYRNKTVDELLPSIRKKYDGDTLAIQRVTAEEFATVPAMKGVNTLGACLVKITLMDRLKRHVVIYGNQEGFLTDEVLVGYVAAALEIPLQVLIDGDIGPGGYGPQWRHWQDTQLVKRTEVHVHATQGYKLLGQVIPSGLPFGEDALVAGLDTFCREKGYTEIDIRRVNFDELPEQGYLITIHPDDAVKSVMIIYGDEESLISAYVAALDIPRFVMHREIDQLANAVKLLKEDPDSRRIIVTAWNPAVTWKAALPPCHLYFQFVSHELTIEQRIQLLNDRIELEKHDIRQEEIRTGVMDAVLRTWATMDAQVMKQTYSDEAIHATLDTHGIKRRGLYCFLLLR